MPRSAITLAHRKRLLITKSSVEREKMIRAVDQVFDASGALKGKLKSRFKSRAVSKTLPLALVLIRQARLLKPALSLAPLLFKRVRRPVFRVAALGAVAAFLAWKGRDVITDLLQPTRR